MSALDVHAQPPDTISTRTFWGGNVDVGYCVQQTRDGGYVVAGHTLSYGAGVHDVWLIRIAPDATEVDEAHAAPDEYQLVQNYPNPFNPTTNISFAIPVAGKVNISVYDLLGNEVRTLLDSYVGRGTGMVSWDGRDAKGRMASTGIYFCRMTSGSFAQSLQMLLLK